MCPLLLYLLPYFTSSLYHPGVTTRKEVALGVCPAFGIVEESLEALCGRVWWFPTADPWVAFWLSASISSMLCRPCGRPPASPWPCAAGAAHHPVHHLIHFFSSCGDGNTSSLNAFQAFWLSYSTVFRSFAALSLYVSIARTMDRFNLAAPCEASARLVAAAFPAVHAFCARSTVSATLLGIPAMVSRAFLGRSNLWRSIHQLGMFLVFLATEGSMSHNLKRKYFRVHFDRTLLRRIGIVLSFAWVHQAQATTNIPPPEWGLRSGESPHLRSYAELSAGVGSALLPWLSLSTISPCSGLTLSAITAWQSPSSTGCSCFSSGKGHWQLHPHLRPRQCQRYVWRCIAFFCGMIEDSEHFHCHTVFSSSAHELAPIECSKPGPNACTGRQGWHTLGKL